MRLVLMSDSHTYHQQIEVPDGDIFIHCGDATFNGARKEIVEFNRWLGTLPHTNKLFVAGNHDFLFEEDAEQAESLMTNAIYLKDSMVDIQGIKVWGSPWVNKFFDWAFMLPEEGLKVMFDKIPTGIDVLATHGPPWGILDTVNRGGHAGSKELYKAIRRAMPKIVCFGHIHEGYGMLEEDDIKYYNCSVNNAGYDPVNKPFVIDL